MSAALTADPTLLRSSARRSPASRILGRVLSGIAIAFLTFDVAIKFSNAKEAIEGTTQLGWQVHHLPILGTLGFICLILYVVPRTAPIGAVLWTGYLGGAIATHLRIDNPLFSHILFPLYVAVFIWGGLYLRDARVRALLGSAR
jgi:hypothetical protein